MRKTRASSFKRDSTAQEKAIASDLGGRVAAGSGAPWYTVGDVETEFYVIEAKTCRTDKHTINVSKLNEFAKKALLLGKEPMYIIDFVSSPTRGCVVVCLHWRGIGPPQGRSTASIGPNALEQDILHIGSNTWFVSKTEYSFANRKDSSYRSLFADVERRRNEENDVNT